MNANDNIFTVEGYDKDADVYECLTLVYAGLDTAIQVADYMATLSLRRKSNNEPFDWLEVIGISSGDRYHIAPCV